MQDLVPNGLRRILAETPALRKSFFVGGCVRDWLWERPIHDFDIEVYGVNYEQLAAALGRWGKTDLVGRSFGVVKLTTAEGAGFDFTIPRKDSKVGIGHKGFEIVFDPNITLEEAAARRDFTINAIAYDWRNGSILDFFGGTADLRNRVLRHTSPAFGEDPLRVLRGMQFAARFELSPAPETVELSRAIKSGYRELAAERVREEWFKWAEKSVAPSLGLRFLEATGWLEHFPEIQALRGTPQDPEWHPEGDVFTHTCHCCDAMAKLPEWQNADAQTKIVYMMAILAHDFAKPATTHMALKDGVMRTVSPGHEEAGGPLAEQFLQRINAPLAIQARVVPLVMNHLAHLQTVTDRSVRRLAKRLEPETIAGLSVVVTADHSGRPPKPPGPPAKLTELLAKAGELRLQSSAPKPILLGRHLLELGRPPGVEMGKILKAAFEAQLEGEFEDLPGALEWLKRQPLHFQIVRGSPIL